MFCPAPAPSPLARRLAGCLAGCALFVTGALRGAAGESGEIQSRPLAPRSGPRGATMFTELSPEQTGVATTNNYADPKMWGALFHESEVGAFGAGVALGDYDGAGRPDLFVVS